MDSHKLNFQALFEKPTGNATMGIIYNDCYGGYNLSEKAECEYKRITGHEVPDVPGFGYASRHDEDLVRIVEKLGSKEASGRFASLRIKYTEPEYAPYIRVDEYDGKERLYFDRKRYCWAE